MSQSNLSTVERYLAALEDGAAGDDLARFFSREVVQEEFPNRLVPGGARRDLHALLEGADRGKRLLRSQRYRLLHAFADGETVAAEVQWVGTLAVDLGTLSAGSELRARFALFIEFRDGQIVRQRNYDCYDPW